MNIGIVGNPGYEALRGLLAQLVTLAESQDIVLFTEGDLTDLWPQPVADLAVALAIVSSMRNVSLEPGMVAIGEVGLSGELRAVPQMERRLAEATRLGLSPCLVPAGVEVSPPEGVQILAASTLSQALHHAFPTARKTRPATSDE